MTDNQMTEAEAKFEREIRLGAERSSAATVLENMLLSDGRRSWAETELYDQKRQELSKLHPPRVAAVLAFRQAMAELLMNAAKEISHEKYRGLLAAALDFERMISRNYQPAQQGWQVR